MAIESATIEEMVRIQHVLDPFHEFEIRSWGRPQVKSIFLSFGSKLYYSVASSFRRRFRRLRVIEVSIADARSRARHDRRLKTLHHFTELRESRGDSHDR